MQIKGVAKMKVYKVSVWFLGDLSDASIEFYRWTTMSKAFAEAITSFPNAAKVTVETEQA